ncbi:MAG: NusG domain II-containing protein [Clostridia bacterium]|nr:NusG domain II-containing protein [Clostridia bacterium]
MTTPTRKRRNDVIFIAILLAAAMLLGVGMYVLRSEGDSVTVTVDGHLYGTYPLSEDTTVDIRTAYGYNRLVIRDGQAKMEDADCPDGICAAHVAISRMGQSIVCLPHKVVVTVAAAVTADTPDMVV